MSTRWCLQAHNTSPAVIDKVLPVNKKIIYSNPMARACHKYPVGRLWDIHINNKNRFPAAEAWKLDPIQRADRECFIYIESTFDSGIITALAHLASKSAQRVLLDQDGVVSPFFGTLPLLIRSHQ